MTLNLPTTHWLSSLGSDSIFVSLPVQIPLCSAGLPCSKSVFYFAIGLYLLDGVYIIAYYFGNCNSQNIQSLQNIFVQRAELWEIFLYLLQLTNRCGIIKNVVVSLTDSRDSKGSPVSQGILFHDYENKPRT